MLLIILVKRDLRDCFTQIQSASAGAGLMGLMVWFYGCGNFRTETLIHRLMM